MLLFNKFFLLLAVGVSLVSCERGGRLKEWMAPSPKPKILSTIAQVGDLVSQIGGERIAGWVLIQGDLDPHSYELVKGDDEKFLRADLIFYNGLGLEHGASLAAQLQAHPRSVAIGEKIAEARPNAILKKGGVVDPHVWMDISLWKEAVDPIVENLSSLDPEGASYYQERGRLLTGQMERAHQEVRALLEEVPAAKRYLITSHDAFRYFVRGYLSEPGEAEWASRFAAPEGLAPDGQLNPYDIQKILDFLKEKQITVVFPESNVSRDSIRKIASAGKEMGLEVRVCSEPLYGDSTSGLSYLEMMRKNGEVIARHL